MDMPSNYIEIIIAFIWDTLRLELVFLFSLLLLDFILVQNIFFFPHGSPYCYKYKLQSKHCLTSIIILTWGKLTNSQRKD